MALCRLDHPGVMADLTEVAVVPTRFVFVILSPTNAPANTIWENSEIARSVASLLADKVCYCLEVSRCEWHVQLSPVDLPGYVVRLYEITCNEN